MRRPAAEWSGEERGDVKAPPSFGECVTVRSVGGESWSSAGAIFRFLVEAVVKLGRLPWSRWSSRARQKSVWEDDALACQRTTACFGDGEAMEGASVRQLQFARGGHRR